MIDNLQATNWFVGILDGEGSLSRDYHNGCRIRISNTELDIIEKCQKILLDFGIVATYSSGQRGHRKREYDLRIQGVEDCKRLYKSIEKFLHCSKEKFQQIIGASTTTREIPVIEPNKYWLAGVMEAEGSYSISRHFGKGLRSSYSPVIAIANTNFAIIEKVVKCFHSLGLAWHVSDRLTSNPNHSDVKTLTISGYKRVIRACYKLQGLFGGKRAQTRNDLILEFVSSRLEMDNSKLPYTQRQHDIYYRLREMT